MKENLLYDLAHLAPGDILSNLEGDFRNPMHYMLVLERHADGGLEFSVPSPYILITRLPHGPFYLSPEGERFPFVDRDRNAVFYMGPDMCMLKNRPEGRKAVAAYSRLLEVERATPRQAEDTNDSADGYPFFDEMLLVVALSASERLRNDIERSHAVLRVLEGVPREDRPVLLSCIMSAARGNALNELCQKTKELERAVLNRAARGKLLNGELRSLRCHPLPKFMH